MKVRFSPLRIRLLVFGAIAFTILSLGAIVITLTVIRKSTELNYELKRISDAQLVKLYLEDQPSRSLDRKRGLPL